MSHPVKGCGIGLRFQHIDTIVDSNQPIPWLEILTDNYLLPGSVQQDYLFEIAEHYPLTFHGVGMSLGSTDPLDTEYVSRVKALVERVNPAWVSDHLCWTSAHGVVTHDLIPLPYTEETIRHVSQRISQVQDSLERRLVIENVSSYLQYQQSAMSEWDFLCAVVEAADCDILLDVNNIYVSACNHDFDPLAYLNAIPVQRVREIHLAGYEDRGTHLLDTHGYPVSDAVWALYAQAIQRFGAVPTLIEWDNNVPELPVLLAEAAKAAEVQARVLA